MQIIPAAPDPNGDCTMIVRRGCLRIDSRFWSAGGADAVRACASCSGCRAAVFEMVSLRRGRRAGLGRSRRSCQALAGRRSARKDAKEGAPAYRVLVLYPRASSAYDTEITRILRVFDDKEVNAEFTVINFELEDAAGKAAIQFAGKQQVQPDLRHGIGIDGMALRQLSRRRHAGRVGVLEGPGPARADEGLRAAAAERTSPIRRSTCRSKFSCPI